MKLTKQFLFLMLAVCMGTMGISCSVHGRSDAPLTPALLPATKIGITPSITSLPAPLPTQSFNSPATPSPTAVPYPTASVVKANAVAFIARNSDYSLDTSLWVANVDGSGERKLVEIAYNEKDGWTNNPQLQWSPDGNWIGYIASHELWIVARDGATKRKLLSLPDTREIFMYKWSPDSSKIAYLESVCGKSTATPTPGPDNGMAPYLVGLIDIAAGNVSELSSFEANAGIPILLWSPSGRDLLFIKDRSLVLLEVATRKVVKTIKRGCGLERGLSWSPNGKWFSYTDNGVGGFNPTWICVNSVTGGVIHEIYVDSTSFNPIWDKTGNYLYFLASKIDLARKPDPLLDERLMRYDARTQEIESLLSLKEQPHPNRRRRSLSISPDGNTLLLQSESSRTKLDLIFVDVRSLAIKKSSVDFGTIPNDSYSEIKTCGWSPDGKDIIFFLGSYDYGYFSALDIRTEKHSIFSGSHPAENIQVSPISTTP